MAPVCSPIQLRERQQLRGLRMLRGGVAEQHRLALAGQQQRRRWRCASSPASHRTGAATPLACGHGGGHLGQRLQPSALGAAVMRAATGIAQSSCTACRLAHLARPCARPGAGAARTADGPCAGTSRPRTRARSSDSDAIDVPSQRTPSRRRCEKSAWRVRWSMLLAAQAAHQLGRAGAVPRACRAASPSAPMPSAPNSALMRLRPSAT